MTSQPQSAPLFVGNHLALDFINTEYGVGPRHHECLGNDHDVAEWLNQAGCLDERVGEPPAGLAVLAHQLRECAKAIMAAIATSNTVDLTLVNHILEVGRPTAELVHNSTDNTFRLVENRRWTNPAALLEPVAKSLAGLLAEYDLQRIRECEAPDCTLLFYDQSKSQRRRWCSMSSCGNRMKAATHRARKNARQ